MVLEISESEMIERYSDSLNKSASRAVEFTKAEEQKKPQLFVEFIDGLKVAAGSAHQLAHAQMNPQWLSVRDFLEKIIDLGQELPTFGLNQNRFWLSIEKSLKTMAENGLRMARAKPLSRQVVLGKLDERQKALDISLGTSS